MMTDVPVWAWVVFGVVMALCLGLDLWLHRGGREQSRKAALAWGGVWVGVALAFNLFVAWLLGGEAASEFLGAYVLEQSLSVDNLLVFLLVFRALRVPPERQRRVLSWGVFGALLMRALFIGVGAAAVQRWHALLYVFGAMLVYAGAKLLKGGGDHDAEESKLLGWLGRRLPWTPELQGDAFAVQKEGRWLLTPLALALVAVELSDVIFAVDSVPAGFGVTQTPFILYTSNIFAVLGLRSWFAVLSGALGALKHLHYGLAAVLIFIGGKMLVDRWVHVPILISLGVIALCLGVAIVASLRARKAEPAAEGR